MLCLLNLTASFPLALLIITLPLHLGSSNNKLIDPEMGLNGPGKRGKLSSPVKKKDREKDQLPLHSRRAHVSQMRVLVFPL